MGNGGSKAEQQHVFNAYDSPECDLLTQWLIEATAMRQ